MRALDALAGLVAPPLCWSCGAAARPRAPLCGRCDRHVRCLPAEPVELCGVHVWAPVAYDGPVRAVVAGLKFGRAAGLADAIAAQLVAGAPDGALAPPMVLVPVPPRRPRPGRRGFDQALLIARAVSRRSGLEVSACLRRTDAAGTQVGRSRAARLLALDGAVALACGRMAPRAAVVVDDVVTTGATVSACAAALRGGGCARVTAVAYALTPGR